MFYLICPQWSRQYRQAVQTTFALSIATNTPRRTNWHYWFSALETLQPTTSKFSSIRNSLKSHRPSDHFKTCICENLCRVSRRFPPSKTNLNLCLPTYMQISELWINGIYIILLSVLISAQCCRKFSKFSNWCTSRWDRGVIPEKTQTRKLGKVNQDMCKDISACTTM
jgi:hypothetical protein